MYLLVLRYLYFKSYFHNGLTAIKTYKYLTINLCLKNVNMKSMFEKICKFYHQIFVIGTIKTILLESKKSDAVKKSTILF